MIFTLEHSNQYYKLNVCFSGEATPEMEVFTSRLKTLLAGEEMTVSVVQCLVLAF